MATVNCPWCRVAATAVRPSFAFAIVTPAADNLKSVSIASMPSSMIGLPSQPWSPAPPRSRTVEM